MKIDLANTLCISWNKFVTCIEADSLSLLICYLTRSLALSDSEPPLRKRGLPKAVSRTQ